MAIAYPVDVGMAAPVTVTMARAEMPQGELQQWLAAYPTSGGGPRGDQLRAHLNGAVANMGFKSLCMGFGSSSGFGGALCTCQGYGWKVRNTPSTD